VCRCYPRNRSWIDRLRTGRCCKIARTWCSLFYRSLAVQRSMLLVRLESLTDQLDVEQRCSQDSYPEIK